MKSYLILIICVFSTFSAFAEGTQEQLEVNQRNVVIEEMAEKLLYSFRGKSREELLQFLKNHPKAINNPEIVSEEGDNLFWGTTVKFEFEHGKLIKVFW